MSSHGRRGQKKTQERVYLREEAVNTRRGRRKVWAFRRHEAGEHLARIEVTA